MTPTPEQVSAALRIAECCETPDDHRTIDAVALSSEDFSDTAARVLAAHVRAVHAYCLADLDQDDHGWTAACKCIAKKLIPSEPRA